MMPEETLLLDRCCICGSPVRRGVAVIRHSTGEEGVACKACLRRHRRTVDTSPK
jgi:hypothetical protein